ncbi:hypothetical protein SAMN05446635_9026 [Burkholderia sp. OK233]|nr:hypothetical protein SAMN05446635_9026 [Burkholderia sp. OK233]
MNSSRHCAESGKAAPDPIFYRDQPCSLNLETADDGNPSYHPGPWEVDVSTTYAARSTHTDTASLAGQGFPDEPKAVAGGSRWSRTIRFIDGEAAPSRGRRLAERMRQLGTQAGRSLLVYCRQGEQGKQLTYLASWTCKKYAQAPTLPIIIGIDGVDQWLTSPGDTAHQLQAILDAGAIVLCGVDSRYADSRVLTFQLLILDIMVIREAPVPTRSPAISFVDEIPRVSPDLKSAPPVRTFPDVYTSALPAYFSDREKSGAQTPSSSTTDQREVKRRGASSRQPHSAEPSCQRVTYAGYQNESGVNRIQRKRCRI